MYKIFVLDDEKQFLDIVNRNLIIEGFKTIYSNNTNEALIMLKDIKVDLLLTDAQLSGFDGFQLCKIIRNTENIKNLPIIIMSGKDIEEEDILKGFELGADDYLIKPFSFKILKARILAVLKRFENSSKKTETIKKIGLFFNPESREVKFNNNLIKLTRKEFDLLNLFLNKTGRVLSNSYILQNIWGYDPALYNDPHTVEVHIYSLKKKLGKKLSQKIITIPGVGHKLEI